MNYSSRFYYHTVGNILLLLIVLFFGFRLIVNNNPWEIHDFVNLFVHEAGHLVFTPFGDLMQFLGGTILQLLFPILFGVTFAKKGMLSGLAFSLFWLGENLVNVAYYMSDAVLMKLNLVGGGIHDWNWIFSYFGILQLHEQVARNTKSLGLMFVTLSIILLLYLIYKDISKIIFTSGHKKD